MLASVTLEGTVFCGVRLFPARVEPSPPLWPLPNYFGALIVIGSCASHQGLLVVWGREQACSSSSFSIIRVPDWTTPELLERKGRLGGPAVLRFCGCSTLAPYHSFLPCDRDRALLPPWLSATVCRVRSQFPPPPRLWASLSGTAVGAPLPQPRGFC